MVHTGKLLTFEGVDGAGKSTHLEWTAEYLRAQGMPVILTREPGGTPLGERLRELLLVEPMHLETETLLMFAARCEHLRMLIEPALAAGTWVVCDRFTDATFAYQGAGRELGHDKVSVLEHWVHPYLQPDRTWLFDLDLGVARQRLVASRDLDRFEREGADFFTRTRDGYYRQVNANPDRFKVIDAARTIEQIRDDLKNDLDMLVDTHRRSS